MALQTAPRRAGRKHAPETRPVRKRKGIFRRFWWVWIPAVLVLGTGIGALSYVYTQLSIKLDIQTAQTSVLKDRNGRFLAEFHGEVDRTEIPFSEMPRVLRRAVIAAEDEDFFEHSGFDVLAIVRAAWADLTGGGIVQGGSTITQQYVRNAFPEVGTERTITRKIKELLLAIKLEQELPKRQILERYLNTIYFGQGAYGVEAAAQTYFGISAEKLDIVESATLAGIISSPEANNPVTNEDSAIERRNYVLGRMAEVGFITPERAAALSERGLKVKRYQPRWQRSDAAYYIDYTKRWLEQQFEGATFSGGLRVQGSLDWEWQQAALEAIESHPYEYLDNPEVALAAVDVHTGEIRAMVGGRDFEESHVNIATGEGGTGRQSGSAFKPFTLMAYINKGFTLNATFEGPSQIELTEPPCDGWDPMNYGESGQGTMNVISATANSVNTIYAQLVNLVYPEEVARIAKDMGIDSDLTVEGKGSNRAVPCAITLGTQEVTPLEMAEAFATFASLGVHHETTPVRVVKNPDGEIVDDGDTPAQRPRWLDEDEALQAVYAMKQVVCCGTATLANGLPFEVFGKTGTTDDAADVWFCGASTEVAACVWVGHPEGRVSMGEATGGTVALPIWVDFMAAIHQDLEPGTWETPELAGIYPESPDIAILSEPSPVPEPEPSPSPEPEPSPSPEPEPTEDPTEEPPVSPPPTPSPSPTKDDGGG